MRRPLLLLAFLLIASGANAALTKHKEWLQSPEAYFATDAERKQWKSVRTDEEAESFLAKFRQRRGGLAFTDMVKHRTGIADRFFSAGDRKGSATLRGKMVILFGAPSGIGTSRLLTKRDPYVPPMIGPPGSANVGSMASAHHTRGARQGFWLVTMSFPAGKVPAFNGVDYVVTVEVRAADNSDKLARGMNAKELDRLFDAAIAASIVNP